MLIRNRLGGAGGGLSQQNKSPDLRFQEVCMSAKSIIHLSILNLTGEGTGEGRRRGVLTWPPLWWGFLAHMPAPGWGYLIIHHPRPRKYRVINSKKGQINSKKAESIIQTD